MLPVSYFAILYLLVPILLANCACVRRKAIRESFTKLAVFFRLVIMGAHYNLFHALVKHKKGGQSKKTFKEVTYGKEHFVGFGMRDYSHR